MERLGYIDIAKFIGVTLMIVCHAGMHNMATSIIYAFHMPLFFFLSGYLYSRKGSAKVDFWNGVKKRSRSILIPYFIFALILCFGTKKLADWPLLIYASRDALYASSTFTALWFLPCFFISSVLFLLLTKVRRKSELAYYSSAVGIVLVGFFLSLYRSNLPYGYPWNFDAALVGVGIMVLGSDARSRGASVLNPKWGGVFLLLGICFSLFNLPESLTKGNPHVEMSVSSWGNPLLFILNATLLSMATIVVSKLLESRCNRSVVSLMSFYGANTIVVLCLHGTILKLFQIAFKPFHLSGTIYAIVITIVCLAILYHIIKFINSELPNIVGRK